MNDVLLPTSLVGSYAQPEWLIDRKNLPRPRHWKGVGASFLAARTDGAAVVAGCCRRESGKPNKKYQ
jgi:hypothetical protein